MQLRHPAVVASVPADGLKLGTQVELRLDAADPDERKLRSSLVT